MTAWLQGFEVVASGNRAGPAHVAGSALAALGARVRHVPSPDETLTDGDRRVRIPGWVTEGAARAQAGLPALPAHPLASTYLGLRAAESLLADCEPVPLATAAELVAGIEGSAGAELIRGDDGWLVARWRTPSERLLFAQICQSGPVPVEDVAADARELRLLVAPVRRPGQAIASLTIEPGSRRPDSDGGLRVIDWSNLWAGPWVAMKLAERGARVDRIEHPSRRGGYSAGSRFNSVLNRGKWLNTLDLATPPGLREATELFESADILISGQTPRVRRNFGFDDRWTVQAGLGLLVELVAYEAPNSEFPGLGEQAAAMSGLLWNEPLPSPPLPWADPLLGAQALLAITAWERAGRPGGARIRLSLEGAARLATAGSRVEEVTDEV